MKRIQLFEFEDFKWFPSWMRKAMTNLIVVLHKMLGVSEVLAKLVAKVVQDKKLRTVVDLGFGIWRCHATGTSFASQELRFKGCKPCPDGSISGSRNG